MLELTVSDLGEDATRNLSGLDEMPDDATDKIMRTLHFLDARGYVPLQEALDITAGELDEGNWYPFAVKTLGQSVGRRMGMKDRAMPAAFEALMNYTEEQLEEELDPTISMEPLVEKALLFDLDLLEIGGEARDVTLYIPVEPYMTNGAWMHGDETEVPGNQGAETSDTRSYVEWEYPLSSVPPGGDLAQVVYAFWAEPDEAYQVEHFGSLIVDGDLLAEQCRWRQMLGPSLRDEWDAFIDSLRPGPELADTLRGFLFSIEETAGADDPVATRSRIARHVSGRLASGVESTRPKDDEGPSR